MIHRPMLYRLSCAHHSNLQKAGSTLRPNFKTSCVTVESTLLIAASRRPIAALASEFVDFT